MTKQEEIAELAKDDKERELLTQIAQLDSKKLAAALKLAAHRGEPLVIDKADQQKINANLSAIADGSAIVVDTKKPVTTLAANQIPRERLHKLTPAEMAKVATGELVVV